MIWIGVDVGGTFTDLVVLDDETGELRVAKHPTTPAAPDEGVLQIVRGTLGADELGRASHFIHGTTVGLNALLERDEGRMALLTTQGFRDILEIRRGDRTELYNLFWQPPAPLVPRHLRLEVRERTGADGSELIPVELADVRRAAATLEQEGIETVAVVLLHSYANPGHERTVLDVLRESGFKGHASLSSAISGEFREYERTCTTVIDAYVRRRVAGYLERLATGLSDGGFTGDAMITRSGGGAMTFAEAGGRPFETILSGPVAGAEGAAALAREMDLPAVVTADVGGTSFDTSLIVDGRPHTLYEGVVNGLPVQAPWVDVRSIGAGGGSIAYIDPGGLLRVGPRSAGAVPGPACYGRGGEEPTVTDAALVLGMLADGILADGARLDRNLAVAALERVASQLSMSVEATARGILEIVTAGMANAIAEITIDQGEDPRTATLMPFGGAGPLFASLLARQLGMTRVVVPPYAGNFSAYGLLVSDLIQSAAQTRIRRVDDRTPEDGNEMLSQLFASLSERSSSNGSAATGESARQVALDMRYVGQEHTITVEVPCTPGGQMTTPAPELLELFAAQYEKTYASTMDEDVEIITWRATVRTALPERRVQRVWAGVDGNGTPRTLPVYSFTRGAVCEFTIVDREEIAVRGELAGPAIVLEDTTTTYLDAGFTAAPHESGALVLTDTEGSKIVSA